jgi:glycosyltransferase involved in cell wall biosynthesis
MRLLMLMPRAPYPADHGAALRNFYLMKWLGSHHDVSVVAYGDPGNYKVKQVLEGYVRDVHLVPPPRRSMIQRLTGMVTSREPDLAKRLWSQPYVDVLRSLLARQMFDVVQIEGLEMFRLWTTASDGRQGTGPIIVLDEHNAEYVLQESARRISLGQGKLGPALYSLIQARRLRRYEREACRIADGVIAVSKDDAAALAALCPTLNLAIIPNGVDTTLYQRRRCETTGQRVLFIGKMDYRPNVDAVEWFCRAVWPLVRQERPDARFRIVGRDPTARVQALGQIPGVEVMGEVSDERPEFEQADLLVVPMRMGSGVRLKVLQSMAMAVPLVSTSLGMSGVPARPGVEYVRADAAPDFARGVVQVLGDSRLRGLLGEAGRRLVCQEFDWRVIMPRLDILYNTLVEAREA